MHFIPPPLKFQWSSGILGIPFPPLPSPSTPDKLAGSSGTLQESGRWEGARDSLWRFFNRIFSKRLSWNSLLNVVNESTSPSLLPLYPHFPLFILIVSYCSVMFPQFKKNTHKSHKCGKRFRFFRSCAIFIWIERAPFRIPIRIAFSRCSMWLYPPAFPFSSLNLSRSIVSDFPFCRHCPFWRDSFTILRGFFCHSPPPSVMRSVSKNPMRKRR